VTLANAPVLYVFLDVADVPRQRATLEQALGLPVIEVEPHQPHERHGVVKYDAGDVILSLNSSTPRKFDRSESDALAIVLDVPPECLDRHTLRAHGALGAHPEGLLFTDPNGHHILLRRSGGVEAPRVTELRLTVEDLEAALPFYTELVGLELLALGDEACLRTGTVPLVLGQSSRAPDGRSPQRRTVLTVFHTHSVESTRMTLEGRGVTFANVRAYFTEIGGTIRFLDPSGNRFCLYEPSPECLTWGSGPKVEQIVHKSVHA
jgi:predicted enzyme related to lactoylglutathione lyase